MSKQSDAGKPKVQVDLEQLAAITAYADIVGISVQDALKEALQDYIDTVIWARTGDESGAAHA